MISKIYQINPSIFYVDQPLPLSGSICHIYHKTDATGMITTIFHDLCWLFSPIKTNLKSETLNSDN